MSSLICCELLQHVSHLQDIAGTLWIYCRSVWKNIDSHDTCMFPCHLCSIADPPCQPQAVKHTESRQDTSDQRCRLLLLLQQ